VAETNERGGAGEEVLRQLNTARLGAGARLALSARRLWGALAHRLVRAALEHKEIGETISRLRGDLAAGNVVRSGYVDHYTEAHELAVWYKYRRGFARETPATNEVVFRAHRIRDEIGRLLEGGTSSSVVNFGCSYAWLEAQVAKQYPRARVVGIDRSETAMELNRAEFPPPNLEFVTAADIFDLIRDDPRMFHGAIFVHVNTAGYFLPRFLERLYGAVHAAGAAFVVGWEPAGLSRQTNAYYRYSFEPQDSVVFRGPMLIHNYPHLLRKAGFDVVRAELAQPPHPHPDFRSITFTAQRAAEQADRSGGSRREAGTGAR
jgi:SAM-dependent methyltransferase